MKLAIIVVSAMVLFTATAAQAKKGDKMMAKPDPEAEAKAEAIAVLRANGINLQEEIKLLYSACLNRCPWQMFNMWGCRNHCLRDIAFKCILPDPGGDHRNPSHPHHHCF